MQWRFNERIFQIISKAYSLAKKCPQLLVCALRVVMNEEIAYRELLQGQIEGNAQDSQASMDEDEENDDDMQAVKRDLHLHEPQHCKEFLILR